jgi:A/G-specific adenine glycosylase
MKKTPKLTLFTKTVWSYYHTNRRDMPWRRDTSLYAVIVSEVMLQQTQVSRVTVKFASWMKKFPNWKALAKAPTKEVLKEWSGLGYNRRALYLKRIAEAFVPKRYIISDISTPKDTTAAVRTLYEKLRELPGIGPNTAGAILAYAYNIPHPFIETNIRSAYIHFFFASAKSRKKIPDTLIIPFIEQTLADPKVRKNPREWYWALMDYGSHLKSSIPNPSRRSAHHATQKPFKGSNRELRSKILKAVLNDTTFTGPYTVEQIRKNTSDLVREGFLIKAGHSYRIPTRQDKR